MVNALSYALAVPPKIDFLTLADLDLVVADPAAAKHVEAIQATHHNVNTHEAITNLIEAGNALKLAYAGTKRSKCNSHVVHIIGTFQTLLKHTRVTTKSFLITSLSALKTHKEAMEIVEVDLKEAFDSVNECVENAKAISTASADLSKRFSAIRDLSQVAWELATEDEHLKETEKKASQKNLDDYKATEASLTAKTASLKIEIEQVKESEKKAEKDAAKAQNLAFALTMTSCIFNGFIGLGKVAGGVIPAITGNVSGAVGGVVSKLITTGIGNKGAAVSAAPSSPEVVTAAAGSKSEAVAQSTASVASAPVQTDHQDLEVKKAAEEESQKLHELTSSKEKLQKKEAERVTIEAEQLPAFEKEIEKLKAELNSHEKAYAAAQSTHTIAKASLEMQKFINPLKSEIKAQEQQSLDQASRLNLKRFELQKEHRDADSLLQEAISRLKSANVEQNDLKQAVISLEIATIKLSLVRTVFANFQMFWEGVTLHAEKLQKTGNLQRYAKLNLNEKFLGSLHEEIWGWVAFAKLFVAASTALENVDKDFDRFMMNLPSKEEAARLVDLYSIQQSHKLQIEEVKTKR